MLVKSHQDATQSPLDINQIITIMQHESILKVQPGCNQLQRILALYVNS